MLSFLSPVHPFPLIWHPWTVALCNHWPPCCTSWHHHQSTSSCNMYPSRHFCLDPDTATSGRTFSFSTSLKIIDFPSCPSFCTEATAGRDSLNAFPCSLWFYKKTVTLLIWKCVILAISVINIFRWFQLIRKPVYLENMSILQEWLTAVMISSGWTPPSQKEQIPNAFLPAGPILLCKLSLERR